VLGLEARREVGEPDRSTALHPGDQMDDPKRGERVARFGHDRRLDARVREARRCGPKLQPTGRGTHIGHGGTISY
jgi:hypothetical protein